jgi:hypothetical protein
MRRRATAAPTVQPTVAYPSCFPVDDWNWAVGTGYAAHMRSGADSICFASYSGSEIHIEQLYVVLQSLGLSTVLSIAFVKVH